MSLSGSRIVDDQRRRRIAIEAESVRSNGVVTRIDEPSTNMDSSKSGSLSLDLTRFVPKRVWVLWLIGVGSFAWLTGLLLSWRFSEEASAAGSPMADMLAPLADRLLRGSGVVAWWLAAQLCCVAWWVRSRSPVDFAGRFHVWGWSALGFAVAAVFCLSDLHLAVAHLMTWSMHSHGRPNSPLFTAFWVLPSLVAGLVWWANLAGEFRDSTPSRIFHGLSGTCGLTLAGLQLWTLRTDGSWQTEVASRMLLVVWQWSSFFGVLWHVRHLVHVSHDPPLDRPSAWSMAWDRGPGRALHWFHQRRLRAKQRIDDERLFEEEVSVSPSKRYIQVDDQEVRIDEAEDAAKGPSRRVRQRVRQ